MKKAIVYIHGKGGNADESVFYEMLFSEYDVIGFDYKTETPWDAKKEFASYFESLSNNYSSISIIANSIGAYFAMNALSDTKIEKAYFISPIVNMEQLIIDMMKFSHVSEDELKRKGLIKTSFNETLSYKYLIWVRQNPIKWNAETSILYGSNDNMQSIETIKKFSNKYNVDLTIMEDGEHWFHTKEQMDFLTAWIKNN